MADSVEPPPLFENVDMKREEAEDDDLFESAVQSQPSANLCLEEDGHDLLNGDSDIGEEIDKLMLNDKSEMENVPINNQSTIATPTMEEVEAEGGDQFIEITITEPQKVGDGMGAYMAYRVLTHTNMPFFKKREFAVMRRFSDFLGLHDKLTEKYLKVGRIIPPAPEKNVIGKAKIKMAQSEQAGNGSDFIERRRAALERYLRRTSQHPVLIVDPDFREFLECDIELPKATNTSALSGAGVMRFINKVGETVNKITYKMEETDPWFENKLVHVEGLENQLRKLHYNVEAMVSYRKELANLTNGVSRSAAMLSVCEDHNLLSRALSQLADTEEKVEAVHMEQANTDFYILCEMLKDYLGLLGSVRDAFHERTKMFQLWQHSQQMLTKKREAKAKLELQGRTDKVDQAGVEVIEWEAKVERSQESFDRISKMIKLEMDRFEKCRIQDFKVTFIKYLENHMEHQAQLVKYWDDFLPEAKAIA
ncbi:PREDICTED: sorting nexin-2-like [Nicrophorus vespilloides]|uniref:Sorting nexin-2-like n=1 Tax=Nicrophorus vespilloides TaxID=110193 RepID=A0ABM1MP36_NICVS|nr:PREDICTED: sorting nexin-2-like [Nicrophorus vespilloides]